MWGETAGQPGAISPAVVEAVTKWLFLFLPKLLLPVLTAPCMLLLVLRLIDGVDTVQGSRP